jgi:hypothetical protein
MVPIAPFPPDVLRVLIALEKAFFFDGEDNVTEVDG